MSFLPVDDGNGAHDDGAAFGLSSFDDDTDRVDECFCAFDNGGQARGRWHTDSLMTHASPLVLETKMRGDGSGEGEAMLDAVYTSKLELLLRQ
eukprot:2561143-Rhodomonas_salina.1